VKERAYWLTENRESVEAGKQPKFVEFGQLKGLQPLVACTNAVQCGGCTNVAGPFYIPLKQGRTFLVCRPGFEDGPFSLPGYDERSGTTAKVLLTPLAVAGDLVIVGSVVGIIYAYGEGGGTTSY
jgi:hypothetical protein